MDLNRTLGKEIEASTLVKKRKQDKEEEDEGKEAIWRLEKNQPKRNVLQGDQLPGGLLSGSLLHGLRSVPESCDTPGMFVS